MHIAFFGSSLVSAYWNGAATYYRGLLKALSARGHRITFYEPNAFQRQQHRDMDDPDWARVVVYSGVDEADVHRCLNEARRADFVVKASGVGVFDELLEREVVGLKSSGATVIYWDVDAPATLQRLQDHPDDPFHQVLPQYDMVLTYGGGPPVVQTYRQLGAADCVPIYNALDPTTHYPVAAEPQFAADLSFLGNRLPDREARVHEFFFQPAAALPQRRFLLGGSGWDQNVPALANVTYAGHVYTHQHNALNASAMAVLNVSRESMAATGWSPATRVFEAAGAAACLITDYWEGIDMFFEPEYEILVARNSGDVVSILDELTPHEARQIGVRALRRVLAEHTYAQRAVTVEQVLAGRGTSAGAAAM